MDEIVVGLDRSSVSTEAVESTATIVSDASHLASTALGGPIAAVVQGNEVIVGADSEARGAVVGGVTSDLTYVSALANAMRQAFRASRRIARLRSGRHIESDVYSSASSEAGQ